jgi:hypothetical protein
MRWQGARRWLGVWMLALVALGLLAGCGASEADSGVGDTAKSDATPVAPSGWKTYANTMYQYSVEYPANWFLSDTSPTTDYLNIYNYDPLKISDPENVPPPPYNKIEIDVFTNPNKLSLPDFYAVFRETDPVSPPASSQQTRNVTVAGHSALEVTQQPVEWTNGKLDYPSVGYYVAAGENVLIVKEEYSTGGQPSDILAHVVGSLKFTQ